MRPQVAGESDCAAQDRRTRCSVAINKSVVAVEPVAEKPSSIKHRPARSCRPYIDMAGELVPGPSKLGGIRNG